MIRSGTNTFHGDGFYYFRNQRLNARDPLATINPDELGQQFGGSFSGPVVKDKVLFFFNYDQQLRDFPLITYYTQRSAVQRLRRNTRTGWSESGAGHPPQ